MLRSRRRAWAARVLPLGGGRYSCRVVRVTEPGLLRRVITGERWPVEEEETYIGHGRSWARLPGFVPADGATEGMLAEALARARKRGEVE
jgi:hypothetical protein